MPSPCLSRVIRSVAIFSHLDVMRLDDASHGSLQSFKTVCENVVTTPAGVKVLADFLSRKLDAIQSSPTVDDVIIHKYTEVAYSALAPKVATDDEITVVNIIILYTFDWRFRLFHVKSF